MNQKVRSTADNKNINLYTVRKTKRKCNKKLHHLWQGEKTSENGKNTTI